MVKKPAKAKLANGPAAAAPTAQQFAEFMMSQLAASRVGEAVDAAQDIMFDAWECDDPKRRVTLAREALNVSADCADAYVLLAMDQAQTNAEALALYAEGVAAGERALGKAAFEEDVGEFWGLLETRPYMRARLGLAVALWENGCRDEATGHANELIRLNPNDNQGIRYLLVSWFLTLGRDAEAEVLLRNYKGDDSAFWSWSRALLAFRQSGDNAAARKVLAAAVANNRHVLPFLIGRQNLPAEPPPYYSPGGRNEAQTYAVEGIEAWAAAPGALDWLRTNPGGKPPRRKSP